MLLRTTQLVCFGLLLIVLSACGGGSISPDAADNTFDPLLMDTPDGEFVQKTVVGDKDVSKTYTPFEDPTADWQWDLIAGQNMYAGTVNVYNDDATLYVCYSLFDGWLMEEAHVLVSTTMPGEKDGKPGQFPYKEEFDPAVAEYTFEIDLSELDLTGKTLIYLATHAAVTNGETLWGGYWNDGDADYDFYWKKWGGGFATYVMPVPDLPNGDEDCVQFKAWHWGYRSYWDVHFYTPVTLPPGSFIHPNRNPDPFYVSWCVDQSHTMRSGYYYNALLYSSYDPAMPDWAKSDNWDMVNYLINQRRHGVYDTSTNTKKQHFQDAVWYFLGVTGTPPPNSPPVGVPDYVPGGGGMYNDLIDDALANGDGYIPSQPGDYYAIILFDCANAKLNAEQDFQMIIIEVDP